MAKSNVSNAPHSGHSPQSPQHRFTGCSVGPGSLERDHPRYSEALIDWLNMNQPDCLPRMCAELARDDRVKNDEYESHDHL